MQEFKPHYKHLKNQLHSLVYIIKTLWFGKVTSVSFNYIIRTFLLASITQIAYSVLVNGPFFISHHKVLLPQPFLSSSF